jgi:hypothetical protein
MGDKDKIDKAIGDMFILLDELCTTLKWLEILIDKKYGRRKKRNTGVKSK